MSVRPTPLRAATAACNRIRPGLRGTPGWWERHIPTGESDAGRLYACLGGDRRWKVLISHKGQQARDIDWLQGAGRL